MFEGVPYLRYEAVLRIMHFDNHADKWSIIFKKNDHLALNYSDTSETTTVLSSQVRRL